MFSRVVLFVISIAVVYSVNAFAETTSSVWQIGGSGEDTLTLVNDEKTIGEELIVLNVNEVAKIIKVHDVSVESYGGAYLVSDEYGNVKEDVSIEVVFKTRYEQILILLEDENFRSAFTVVPETCPAEAGGFLIINDNITAEAFGYCLSPQVLAETPE
jgi:hypothetical protein